MAKFLWSPSKQRAGSEALQAAAGVDLGLFKRYYGDGLVLDEAPLDMKLTTGSRAEWKQASRISKSFDPTKKVSLAPSKLPSKPVEAISTMHHEPKIDPNKPH